MDRKLQYCFSFQLSRVIQLSRYHSMIVRPNDEPAKIPAGVFPASAEKSTEVKEVKEVTL